MTSPFFFPIHRRTFSFSLQATTSEMEKLGPSHAVSPLSVHQVAIPSHFTVTLMSLAFKVDLGNPAAAQSDWPSTGWFDEVHWRAVTRTYRTPWLPWPAHTPHVLPSILVILPPSRSSHIPTIQET